MTIQSINESMETKQWQDIGPIVVYTMPCLCLEAVVVFCCSLDASIFSVLAGSPLSARMTFLAHVFRSGNKSVGNNYFCLQLEATRRHVFVGADVDAVE